MVFVIPYFIPHQGCPHHCLFCNQNSITGKVQSTGEVREGIIETIKLWLGRRKNDMATHFAFYGGSFTCLPLPLQEIMLDAVAPYLKNGSVQQIRLSTRPDCIDWGICSFLQEKGVGTVELGVQSLDDMVLSAAKRGHTESDCVAAVKCLKDGGIAVGIQLMPGLPRESRHSFQNSVRKAILLKPSIVRIYPTVVVADSGLAELYKKGEYVPLSLDKAVVLAAWAKRKFDEAGIRVVRIGLQPSDSLEKNLLAGPYHPAFGELVSSRQWLQKVKQLFAAHPGENLRLTISHRDLSSFNGMKKSNAKKYANLGLADRMEIVVDKDMKRGSMSHVVCKSA